jgi:hypothetical protein
VGPGKWNSDAHVYASFGKNQARVRELKTICDPMDLFPINANIVWA